MDAGLGRSAQFRQCDGKIVMGRRVVGIDAQRGEEMFQSPGRVAQILKRDAQIDVALCMTRIGLQRPTIGLGGFVESALASEDHTQVVFDASQSLVPNPRRRTLSATQVRQIIPCNIGQALASKSVRHREKIGFSQAEYAAMVGVSSLTIYNWESGRTRPRNEQLAALVAVRKFGKREAERRWELLD